MLTLNVGLPDVKYTTQQQVAFYRNLRERIATLPGVAAASAIYPLPLGGDRIGISFETEGRPLPKSDLPAVEFRTISSDYFRAMGIPLRRGRDFTVWDVRVVADIIGKMADLAMQACGVSVEQPERVHLKDIFGTAYIPKEAAEIVKSALAGMLKAGDISQTNRWQALEYWAAECVAK